MRRGLTAVFLLIVFAFIGWQLTKPRWHTLYTRPQLDDKLVLAAECPDGWEEETGPLGFGMDINRITLHPKPTTGFIHWWQQHILRQKMEAQQISITLEEQYEPPSRAYGMGQLDVIERMTPSSLRFRPRVVTTKRSENRMGPELDIVALPPRGTPVSAMHTSIQTYIYPDTTPTNNQAEIYIASSYTGQPNATAADIHNEIVRRMRLIER